MSEEKQLTAKQLEAEQRRQNLERIERAKKQAKQMKDEVDATELKARYWKAQYDVMYYSLKYEELEPAYNEHIERQQAKVKEAFDKVQQNVESTPELEMKEV